MVMAGGRVGKDGIHGATFSSAELDKGSPVQAVQIGDSIGQRVLTDFELKARDRGLYVAETDNGAGGLSSSGGEMAKESNGCVIDLKKVPLKYPGLADWEVLVSESQERMTFAVRPDKIVEFLALATQMGVEATVIGTFTSTGKFDIRHGDRAVAFLDMKFLHEGFPRLNLIAKWENRINPEPNFGHPENLSNTLKEMLARPNIASKEKNLRRYDQGVKGLSIVKPLVGKGHDVPSDATISLLEYGSKEGLIMSQAVNPHYSDIDTYHMTASVIDEAIRRIIAVGGKLPSKDRPFYALDNFCWNLSDLESGEAQYRLAQLVRANKALAEYCTAFGVPCISGKDSMKNVWKVKSTADGKTTEHTIPIAPTLLFSTRAKMEDVSKP